MGDKESGPASFAQAHSQSGGEEPRYVFLATASTHVMPPPRNSIVIEPGHFRVFIKSRSAMNSSFGICTCAPSGETATYFPSATWDGWPIFRDVGGGCASSGFCSCRVASVKYILVSLISSWFSSLGDCVFPGEEHTERVHPHAAFSRAGPAARGKDESSFANLSFAADITGATVNVHRWPLSCTSSGAKDAIRSVS